MATTYGDHLGTYGDWGLLYGSEPTPPPTAGDLCWRAWLDGSWGARVDARWRAWLGECVRPS